jgi:glutamate-ammonia-ligase adenylyltransferase
MTSQALTNWQDALGDRSSPFDQAHLEQVFAWSDFLATRFARDTDWVLQADFSTKWSAGDITQALSSSLVDVADEADLAHRLRVFRNRQMARIIWRDLIQQADLDETLSALSELADACIAQALDHLMASAVAKDGMPRDEEGNEQHLVVLGMGKLGARELNLSSDIDLIFCFPDHGQTDSAHPLENEAFFVRLGRQLIQVLNNNTADGFVFRVDMRLRPFGESGPLVVSFDSLENYLFGQAREWERYAMVKARPLTGLPEDKALVEKMISAFVYRRYIDFGVIEAIRDMKRMIEKDLKRKGQDANVKLGLGGIREVEFIGQAFQLVRGGRDKGLQIRPIKQVLRHLQEVGLIPMYAVEQLLDAYVFLRKVENRLQAYRDEQTHHLPKDEPRRLELARSMWFESWDSFLEKLDDHRHHVHEQFEQVFDAPQSELKNDSVLVSTWQDELTPEQAIELLVRNETVDAEQLAHQLLTFKQSPLVATLSSSAKRKLDRLMPLMLAALNERPINALERIIPLLEAIVRRAAYMDLLIENPLALSQLMKLLSESVWIATQLVKQPVLLDELIDPRRLYQPASRDELADELNTILNSVDEGDLEQEMERMRQFASGNRLRVAAADVADAIPINVVSDHLTEIAEVILRRCESIAWRDLVAKHGEPSERMGEEDSFAVIGYGKLGGIELGYGSDLDLVFLHGCTKVSASTSGEKALSNETFYARLGQKMIHLLTTRTPAGQLYEADMRLRPNGNSGLLVSPLSTFEHYQKNDAWAWEHQALIRARAVSGDPAVVQRFNEIRHEVLCQPRDEEKLRAEVAEMRQKMRGQLDKSDAEWFDLKQGVGGLVDIEFLVQFSVLRWANQYPEFTQWTDNARLLELLAKFDLLPDEQAERLFGLYRVLRARVHRAALQDRPSKIAQTELAEERAIVTEIWQSHFPD